MIHEAAQKLNAPLTPQDLMLLQRALEKVCEIRSASPTSVQAEEDAKVVIHLFQSGIRNRHQLVVMLTGRKFP